MRLIVCFFIFATVTMSSVAQSQKEDIKSTLLDGYFKFLGDQKISKALDYIHPDLINMLGKQTFEEQYRQLFNNPGIRVSMKAFSVDTVSPVYRYQQENYVLVAYSFKMTFVVDMSNDKDGVLHDVLLANYKSQFGARNVTSKAEGTYVIDVKREMFAIDSDKFEGWKFLDFEEGMKVIIVNMIPEEVFEHFNK